MRAGYVVSLIIAAVAWTAAAGLAHAQSCGNDYTVVRGDSLSRIAQRAYSNASQWSLIYYVNKAAVGENPSMIHPGLRLRIPCQGEETVADNSTAESEPVVPAAYQGDASVTLLTADDYRPFTDRGLPRGGMITDIVRTALDAQKQAADGPAYEINWVNDWSAHLNPLLSNGAFDMGFPWFRPTCERYNELDDPAKYRCDTFEFSDPVFEILVLFFARNDASFQFTDDAEIVGKRLCRPSGYFTFDLDKNGRNWVKDEKITLLRPQSVDECFQMLARNEVDAVTINEFTGREAVRKLDMGDRVRTIERPVSVLNLHVIVPKTHPQAAALLANVNAALDRLRKSGTYEKIIERHLSVFWSAQGSG